MARAAPGEVETGNDLLQLQCQVRALAACDVEGLTHTALRLGFQRGGGRTPLRGGLLQQHPHPSSPQQGVAQCSATLTVTEQASQDEGG